MCLRASAHQGAIKVQGVSNKLSTLWRDGLYEQTPLIYEMHPTYCQCKGCCAEWKESENAHGAFVIAQIRT